MVTDKGINEPHPSRKWSIKTHGKWLDGDLGKV